MRLIFLTLSGFLALALPGFTSAHTALIKSDPKHNARLEASPPTIQLEFREATKLTSVLVKRKDAKDRRLEFHATDKSTVYVVTDPQLQSGRNDVQWKALSKDGHVVTGAVVITIGAAPAKVDSTPTK